MKNHIPGEDSVSPNISPEQPQQVNKKGYLLSSKTDGKERSAAKEVNVRPERVSTFKDYLRVFTYATKFDYALMIAAAIASIGAGVVRLSSALTHFVTPERKPRLTERRLFP
jgi:hypothetical protein